MKFKKLASILLTLTVIFILIISGPVSAIQIIIDGESDESLSTTSSLAVASLNATINIESSEIISVSNYLIKITNSSGGTIVNCLLDSSGTKVSGCDYINNTQITYNSANYTYGYLYGYGYTTAGYNETYGGEYGYGYGAVSGLSNEIVITFDWEFQKQNKPTGTYSVNLQAYAVDSSSTKKFTASSAKSFTINSASINETVESSVNTTSAVAAAIGSGNVSVAANVSYIETAGISSNLNTYIKGLVGVSGNVTFNLSIGAGIGGVAAADVTTDSDDVVLDIYLDINGTIDSDLGYADIYIGIPKALFTSLPSNALSNMKVYVLHNDDTEATYTLTRQSDLDTSTEYLFKVRITEFSVFAPFYQAPASTAAGKSTSTECKNNWICSQWSECSQDGIQTRTCIDANKCPIARDKPAESGTCVYTPLQPLCKEEEACTVWSACVDGIRTRECTKCLFTRTETESCATCYDEIRNQGETGVDCGGPCASCAAARQIPSQKITMLQIGLLTLFIMMIAALALLLYIRHTRRW